jgi:hypothetical protein
VSKSAKSLSEIRRRPTAQDARINVHLCLLNCGGAAVVAGGELRNYSDGSLFAFEDRAVSPNRRSHSDMPLYLLLVINHTKYTGVRQNDSNV